mmetsp:Transcript_10499/g.26057  ORF Transcript_10499/g.26057 Transcript_10499/m.26057 type:complete len:269 (-) Transcript_10499:255-1061(-)
MNSMPSWEANVATTVVSSDPNPDSPAPGRPPWLPRLHGCISPTSPSSPGSSRMASWLMDMSGLSAVDAAKAARKPSDATVHAAMPWTPPNAPACASAMSAGVEPVASAAPCQNCHAASYSCRIQSARVPCVFLPAACPPACACCAALALALASSDSAATASAVSRPPEGTTAATCRGVMPFTGSASLQFQGSPCSLPQRTTSCTMRWLPEHTARCSKVMPPVPDDDLSAEKGTPRASRSLSSMAAVACHAHEQLCSSSCTPTSCICAW